MTNTDWVRILMLVKAWHLHCATLYHGDGAHCRICEAIASVDVTYPTKGKESMPGVPCDFCNYVAEMGGHNDVCRCDCHGQ